MQYYLCLNSVYNYEVTKYHFIKGRIYKESELKGSYWGNYLLDDDGYTWGVEERDFTETSILIPIFWSRLKTACL